MTVGVLAVPGGATAQELVTAKVFFEGVSRTYAAIEDYQAKLVVAYRRFELVMEEESVTTEIGGDDGSEPLDVLEEVELSRMEGALSFKRPDLLRIDFTEPVGGVLVSNGEMLTIYLPALNVIYEQPLGASELSNGAPLHTDLSPLLALSFLRTNFAIAYEEGPDPVFLGDGSGQQVVRLILERQAPEEGFETLEIAIGDDNLMRSIVGEYSSGDRVALEFRSVRTNRSIPDARFQYESPPDANVYHAVLFGPTG